MTAPPDTCELIDISGNNPIDIDFARVKASGVVGVYVKATEGVDYVDPHLMQYGEAASIAGLPVLLYHYLLVRHGVQQDAMRQAIEFCNAIRQTGHIECAAVDIELDKNKAATPTEVHGALSDFRQTVFVELGYWPVVYTSRGEWNSWGIPLTGDPCFAKSDLWLADYEPTPHPMSPWSSCVLHQYTGEGTCDGVPGKVDRSRFHGDMTAFRKWYGE